MTDVTRMNTPHDQDAETPTSGGLAREDDGARRWLLGGLAGRLLGLTLIFVLIVEAMIFIPSIAAYRSDWIEERVQRARTAALAAEAVDQFEATDAVAERLLSASGVHAVALITEEGRKLLLPGPPLDSLPMAVDLRQEGLFTAMVEACHTIFSPTPRHLRVLDDAAPVDGMHIEVIVRDEPLRAAVQAYAGRVLRDSILISGLSALLIYAVLALYLVRPIRRLAASMIRFRQAPEDASRIIEPGTRTDEVGQARRELAAMQNDVRRALGERKRLAALGEAIAKINHDLRNILTSAQLVSDRLATHADPKVQSMGARLVRSIDRGVRLAEDVLAYGRADAPEPAAALSQARVVLEDAFADAVSAGRGVTGFDVDAPDDLWVEADPEHVHRILVNLMRNAVQAMEAQPGRAHPGLLTARAEWVAAGEAAEAMTGRVRLCVRDDGPGLPKGAQETLFAAFSGSPTRGGSGLGLAIAAELAQANGGSVALESTGPEGTTFAVELPGCRRVGVGAGGIVSTQAASPAGP